MRYVTANLVRHGDWSAFSHREAELGANALVVAGLVHVRLKTGDGRFDALARRLGRFLVTQTRADGSVLEYWSPVTGRPVPSVFGISRPARRSTPWWPPGSGAATIQSVARTRAGVFATTPSALASDDQRSLRTTTSALPQFLMEASVS
jgi:hypothetical protein